MEIFRHTFRNIGLGSYNDDVLDTLFDLSKNDFTFSVEPKKETQFWRFGIRLSKTENVEFYHPSDRYKDPDFKKYIDIHLSAGDLEIATWFKPNKLELVQYNLPEKISHVLNSTESYLELTKVDWTIKYLPSESVIYVSYKPVNGKRFSKYYSLGNEYKYFKVFAWADMREFELDCKINMTEASGIRMFIEPAFSFPITNIFKPTIGVTDLAEETGKLIRKLKDEKGNMFGIFGKWGRGKTFFWQEIRNYLSANYDPNEPLFTSITFHAWKYQDTPASWAYLYETMADAYFENHNLNNKFIKIEGSYKWVKKMGNICLHIWYKIRDYIIKGIKRIKLNVIRNGFDLINVFIISIVLAIGWYFIIPFDKKIAWAGYLVRSLGIVGVLKLLYLYFIFKPKAINILNKYSEKITFKEYLGLQAEIQKEIIFLLKTWIKKKEIDTKRLLLFVDDIDRCSEDRIIQVVDSLKVMLEDDEIAKRIVVMVAIDERVLQMAIRLKYKDLIKNNPKIKNIKETILDDLTKEYIDKLFLASIKLGHLSVEEENLIFDSVSENSVQPALIEENKHQVSQTISGRAAIQTNTEEIDVMPIPEKESSVTQQYLINDDEKKILTEILPFIENSTPRSIRIYFYRYLLAKNIKKHRIKEGTSLYEEWNNRTNKKILPALIVYYSNKRQYNQIQDDCKNVLNSEEQRESIEIFGEVYLINSQLYYELLRIVEMVVPY